jgi:hypothetical protein
VSGSRDQWCSDKPTAFQIVRRAHEVEVYSSDCRVTMMLYPRSIRLLVPSTVRFFETMFLAHERTWAAGDRSRTHLRLRCCRDQLLLTWHGGTRSPPAIGPFLSGVASCRFTANAVRIVSRSYLLVVVAKFGYATSSQLPSPNRVSA